MKPPLLYEQSALFLSRKSTCILARVWACNCKCSQRKQCFESSDLQQTLHGHIFWVLATCDMIRSRTVFLGSDSQRPQVLRTNSEKLRTERTPNERNKLRANPGQTPNELRASSEQTPNKRTSSERTVSLVDFRTNPRANSEHTLAISMCLNFGGQTVFVGFFRAYQKRPSEYRGQFQQVAWG